MIASTRPRVSLYTETAAEEQPTTTCSNTTNVLQSLNCEIIPVPGEEDIPEGCTRVKSGKVRLGVVAVQIQNPANDKTACIYAFQDTGLQLTLLRKSVADEIGIKGAPIIQYCKGMNSTVKTNMELT